MNMNQSLTNASYAAITATTISALMLALYFVAEPRISRAVAVDTSGPFTVTQTILGENSFLIDAASTTMSGSINGISGGQSFSTTTFSVRSNHPSGYFVDIEFADADLDGVAMLGVVSDSDALRNYNLGATADYNFSTASSSAVFAFTVDSVNGDDTSGVFKNSGASCGFPGGTDEAGQCWIGPSTTAPIRLVQRGPTSSATSSVVFRVYVPPGASPVVETDTYIATATLSLILQ